MRTADKRRISNAFAGGLSVVECLVRFVAAKTIRDVEDAIRWGFNERLGRKGE